MVYPGYEHPMARLRTECHQCWQCGGVAWIRCSFCALTVCRWHHHPVRRRIVLDPTDYGCVGWIVHIGVCTRCFDFIRHQRMDVEALIRTGRLGPPATPAIPRYPWATGRIANIPSCYPRW